MFNRAVAKDDARVEAYGTVDELNAALGMARALGPPTVGRRVEGVQRHLSTLMGELAVLPGDLRRYREKGHGGLGEETLAELDTWIAALEAGDLPSRGWALPGATAAGAAYDQARVVCRRAERRVATLHARSPVDRRILAFLNRLSDLLWLLARELDGADGAKPEGT